MARRSRRRKSSCPGRLRTGCTWGSVMGSKPTSLRESRPWGQALALRIAAAWAILGRSRRCSMDWTLVVPLLMVTIPGSAPTPLAHTFSIVARDPKTGELGVAVQSHYFSVGPIVPWAEAGVGAVATQSLVLVDYGPNGLELMRAGLTAKQALDSLVAADPHHEGRQVAMVDAHGNVAAFTGDKCIPDAGHLTGN